MSPLTVTALHFEHTHTPTHTDPITRLVIMDAAQEWWEVGVQPAWASTTSSCVVRVADLPTARTAARKLWMPNWAEFCELVCHGLKSRSDTHTRAVAYMWASEGGKKSLTRSSSSVLQVDVTYLACSKNTTSTCVVCGRPDQLLLGVLLPRAFILLINHLGYLRRRAQPPRTHTRASRGFVLRRRSCALPCCRVGQLAMKEKERRLLLCFIGGGEAGRVHTWSPQKEEKNEKKKNPAPVGALGNWPSSHLGVCLRQSQAFVHPENCHRKPKEALFYFCL